MNLDFSEPVYEQRYQLRCLPQENEVQKVLSIEYEVKPMDSYFIVKDGFSNTAIVGNAMAEHTSFSFQVKGQVEVDHSRTRTESSHPLYNFATGLTRFSSDMESLIPDFNTEDQMMIQLMRSVHAVMKYVPDSTNITTTASQAFLQKKGVCQDYSHIMLAVCHQMKIPARYVAGMLYGEGETHAWVEVYYGGLWHGFDPTNNRLVDDNYVVLSKGRDYSDCIIDKGIFQVKHFSKQTMKVHVLVSEA